MTEPTHFSIEQRLWAAIILNGFIPALEIAGGIWIGSLALISDALHNFTDFFALVLSLFAQKALGWKANERKTFGYGRIEIMVATGNSLALMLVSAYIFYRAVSGLFLPREIPGGLMMGIASIAFLANIGSALLLKREARKSLNIKSAFLHLLLDAGQSLVVILAGLFILLLRWEFLDPVLSLLIGLFIFWSAWKVFRQGLHILDEGVPPDLNLAQVEEFIRSFPGVESVHHLHLWSLSSKRRALSVHVVMKNQMLSEADQICTELSQALSQQFEIDHPTIQVESTGGCPTGPTNLCR